MLLFPQLRRWQTLVRIQAPDPEVAHHPPGSAQSPPASPAGDPDGPPADEALMRQVAAGDEQALALLYDRYAGQVLGLALKMIGQREVAEELLQETFLRVWRRAQTFDGGRGALAPWLFSIARNLSLDELRRRRVRPQTIPADAEGAWLAELPDPDLSVESRVGLREQGALVRMALRELAAEQREALELAYFSGLSQREIAERLGNPLGTIKTRVRQGLLRLRAVLGGQAGYEQD